jgi:hypothetical protein
MQLMRGKKRNVTWSHAGEKIFGATYRLDAGQWGCHIQRIDPAKQLHDEYTQLTMQVASAAADMGQGRSQDRQDRTVGRTHVECGEIH